MKTLTRGKILDESEIVSCIETSNVHTIIKKRLLALTPFTYTGLSEEIVRNGINTLKKDGVL
jgi:hypothetical protein